MTIISGEKGDKGDTGEKGESGGVTSVNGQQGDVTLETATTTQNGLMSKEDKAKLDTLENIEVIQENGESTTENVYSANAVKELLKNKKDKQQSIITGAEFETRTYN